MSATSADLQSLRSFVKPDSTPKPHFLDAVAKRAVLKRLSQLREGQLTLIDGDKAFYFGEVTERFPTGVVVRVHDQRFYSDIAFGGSVGVGEAYMQGYWSTEQLTDLVRMFVRNMSVLDGMESGLARLTAPL